MPDRSFSDAELELILRRAVRLQSQEPEVRHSLEDVESVAAEVGIPPEFVRRACDSLTAEPRQGRRMRLLLGSRGHVVAVGSVPVPVSDEDFPGVLAIIRSQLKVGGHAVQIGHALEWRLGGSDDPLPGSMLVSLVPGTTETEIRVEVSFDGVRWSLYALPILASAVLGVIASESHGQLWVASVTGGAFLGGWVVVRLLWSSLIHASAVRANKLRDSILAYIGPS